MSQLNDPQQTVKDVNWHIYAIRMWIDLALQFLKQRPITMFYNTAIERLIRAETLESSLEINGPGQTLYEEIASARTKVNNHYMQMSER